MANLELLPPGPFDKRPHETYLRPLVDTFWQRYRWFVDECRDELGIEQYAVSAYRPDSEQVYLRIQNCGGNTYYNIYQKPASQCRPVTAKPGESDHGRGKAIDLGFGYNDVAGPMRAIGRRCGLKWSVSSEDWHIIEDPDNLTEIPAKYSDPQPAPPPEEEEMPAPFVATKDTRDANGVEHPEFGEVAIFYPGTPFRVALKNNEDTQQAIGKPPFGLGLTFAGRIDDWFFENTEPVDAHQLLKRP